MTPPLSDTDRIVIAVIYYLLLLPVVPLAFGWFKFWKSKAITGWTRLWIGIVLAVATASHLILVLGLASHYYFGAASLLTNIGVMTVTTIVAAVTGKGLRLILVPTCAWLILCWLYALVISSFI